MRDAPLLVTSQPGIHPETTIVGLKGPLTLPNSFSFQERVAFLRKESVMRVLTIDGTETPCMDSAGPGCILNSHVSARRNDSRLLLVGLKERLRALPGTAHVDTLVRSYASVKDAEHSLDRR